MILIQLDTIAFVFSWRYNYIPHVILPPQNYLGKHFHHYIYLNIYLSIYLSIYLPIYSGSAEPGHGPDHAGGGPHRGHLRLHQPRDLLPRLAARLTAQVSIISTAYIIYNIYISAGSPSTPWTARAGASSTCPRPRPRAGSWLGAGAGMGRSSVGTTSHSPGVCRWCR